MQKIIWTTNTPLGKTIEQLNIPNSQSGTWLETLFLNLAKAMPEKLFFLIHASFSVKTIQKIKHDNIEYIVMPRRHFDYLDNYKTELNILNNIIEQIGPDLIDIQGTEEFYGLLRNPANCNVIVSLQGLRGQIYKQYFSDIPAFKYYLIALKSFRIQVLVEAFLDQFFFRKMVKVERNILLKNKFFTGRTFFDGSQALGLNSSAKYFPGFHRILRKPFYENKWEMEDTPNYTIHTTMSTSSYKGIFLLIDTIEILKRKYVDIRINIAGNFENFIGREAKRQIKRRRLNNNIVFLGQCTASQIVVSMKKSRIFILYSFIENSPNSLQEAQCLGMPCIAAYTGGIPSIIEEGKTGIFYPPGDSSYLARKAGELFTNVELATALGINARSVCLERNNSEKITLKYVNLYNDMISSAM